ncbi:MAG: lipid-A-disaccharide synthase [Gammaproteobacteria bacterium]|nr:lipid-A-disaccharide synthase [Gammaproteobacteria bacterium]
MPKSIMISAGEASGDLHAANLIKALRDIEPDIQVRGLGGEKLKQAGADPLIDCSDIAVVGIVEVLAKYRTIMGVLNQLRDDVKASPPDLLILVDYQEFNFKLAEAAKSVGVKVLFYISPQIWAWRPHRVHKIGKIIDMMAVLFPFEEKFYRQANVPVRFVGNPLVDEARPRKSKDEAINQYELDSTKPIIGLFPGSRKGEIKRILPIQLRAAELLKQHYPDIQFILPIASSLQDSDIAPYCKGYDDLAIHRVKDLPYDAMQVCDAIIAASGTATLEIALMGIPSVITYRISPISYFILKRLVTIDHIGLVNIVAEKAIVKELIQNDAKADKIADEISKILDDDAYRKQMISELNQVRAKLGKQGGSKNVAQLAYEMLYPEDELKENANERK